MKTVRKKRAPSANDLVALAMRSDIASIGTVVSQIMAIMRNPNSNAGDLRKIIEIDPPLSARMIKRANSAAYGIKRNITSIHEAIVLLGFNTVRELAMNLKVAKLFEGGEGVHAKVRRMLWKHSLAVALSAKSLYRREFKERGDSIYSAGLLHDIGLIVEDQFAWSFLEEVLEEVGDGAKSICEAETEILGFDHCDLGGALVATWKIPEELTKAIIWHHKPFSADPEWQKPVATICACDYMCRQKGIALEPKPAAGESETFEKVLELMNIMPESIELIVDDVSKELDELEAKGELYL